MRMREQGKCWDKIICHLPGRGKDAIKQRCEELGCGFCEQYWTPVEAEALRIALVPFEGQKNWKKVAEQVPGRTAKECKNRLYSERRRDKNSSF